MVLHVSKKVLFIKECLLLAQFSFTKCVVPHIRCMHMCFPQYKIESLEPHPSGEKQFQSINNPRL